MDAVGLASSIITFIDVAYKIIRASYDVYDSTDGTTKENHHTGLLVSDLKKVAADLKNNPQMINDTDLVSLSTQCYDLSGELLQLLEESLPKGPGKWQSSVSAIRILRRKKEVASMETRLDRYRQQISERLLWILLYVL